jgi:hypothetical protein
MQRFIVKSIATSAQPGSPTDGDTYLLPASGCTGSDWAGQDGRIARYDQLAGWLFFRPGPGSEVIVDDASATRLIFTPATASPAATWVRRSQFLASGGGSASSDLTTSFAELTEWSAPEKVDLIGSYGCFDWDQVTPGTMTLARDCYGPLKIRAKFLVQQVVAGNLNSYTVKMQKDSGAGWSDVAGCLSGGATYSNALMFVDTSVITYSDDAASSGDQYRFVAQAESDSGSNILRVQDMVLEMYEDLP